MLFYSIVLIMKRSVFGLITTATEKSIWLEGFSRAWKQLTITLGFASGNSQQIPGPPESLKPDRFSCCPRDQSLFVYYLVCFYILSWLAYLNSNKTQIHIVMSKLESKHNYKAYVTEHDCVLLATMD